MPKNVSTFSIALSAVFITRLILWFLWDTSIFAASKTDIWHHAYTGLILFIGGGLIANNLFKLIFQGIGVGLMIDEATVPFKILGIWEPDYWSIGSWGTAIVLFGTWLLYLISQKTHIANTK